MLRSDAFIIKVCGITNLEDARIAVDAGANALGFNFYSKSPRYIEPSVAAEIIDALDRSTLAVGVFVNASAANVHTIASHLDVVQLHGSRPDLPGFRVWRSIPSNAAIPDEDASVEMYLLDSFTPEYGGSGRTFDWSAARGFPYPFVVAGGLDSTNVAEAVSVLQPRGVDACSRIESSPGRKDPLKVTEFVRAASAAYKAMHRQELVL